MTSAYADPPDELTVPDGVYAPSTTPSFSSRCWTTRSRAERRVADLCTGSGVAAIGAARQGAVDVMAFDISAEAVRCARHNALAAGVEVDVHLGTWSRAIEFGPFGLVLCNPPYVPEPPDGDVEVIPAARRARARHSTPVSTAGWCWTRCARRRRTCSPKTARC